MFDKLPILAIETSQIYCGACVYFDEQKHFELSINQRNSHAEKIFEIIDKVIITSGIQLSDLKAISVSAGPGSFTGLRIGMSAAKGIATGLGIPIIPVPTFEALAFQLSNQLCDGTNFIIANKVNSEEIYFAKFQVKANNYIFTQHLQIVTLDDVVNLTNNCLIFGNADFKNVSTDLIHEVTSPKPEFVAKWAHYFGFQKIIYDFESLEPNYLKEFIIRDKSK
ncbi:MAG: tRNA (adenosine(37)-N6)-threonylcarbamoyltransferase complex dimerization subunit type 1 TsaB [Ignavibacteriaceae bacterium]|nr:tRNA (adenosine(37)-N6)-threonylcarbamoyltransferase complex dimerization subunit type 1 TsaB [Ignavibacteriaceae bacterium]